MQRRNQERVSLTRGEWRQRVPSSSRGLKGTMINRDEQARASVGLLCDLSRVSNAGHDGDKVKEDS